MAFFRRRESRRKVGDLAQRRVVVASDRAMCVTKNTASQKPPPSPITTAMPALERLPRP
jgi:hypothetical protein